MQPYYNTPAGPGMGMGGMPGGMGMGIQGMGMGMQGTGGMGMQQGMPMMMGGGPGGGIMNPMQQQHMQMQQQQMAQGMMGTNYGQAWKNLGYDYTLPELGYTPSPSWGAWDLATARYTGDRLQRGFFDNLLTSLGNFFSTRHLSEDSARNAHRRVYHSSEGEDAGNRTLGGAAAYQAWLLWDRDHYSAYHQMPSPENMQRLVGLAVAELHRLWDHLNPRSSRANLEEASQYAAATAKYLYERHYDIPSGSVGGSMMGMGGIGSMYRNRHSGYGADDDSDSESEGRRMRRRSMYGRHSGGMGMGHMGGGMMPMQGMQGMQHGLPMHGMHGQGMVGIGMSQPGYGAMGMSGAMANGMGGMMHGGIGGGMGGMGGMSGLNPMMMQSQMGLNPMMMQGGYGNPNNEAQAAPGMHPYHYGATSGVAYGAQPIDQMGNPTLPGGPGRSWYSYGQPRPF